MQFQETEEQSMIREMVRDFAEEVLAPTCLARDKAQQPPLEEWAQFIEYGLQSCTIPEDYGGVPLDDVSEAIIVEELARVDASFAVFFCVHVGLCAKTIVIHGTEEQKAKYLPMLATDKVGAYSLSEAGAGTDAAAMSCKAKLSEDGTHYLLTGEKMWVTNGVCADIYVLFAKDVDHPDYGVKKHGGTTAFIIEQDFEGFTVGKKEDKLGIRATSTCELLLDECRVPRTHILGELGRGYKVAIETLNEGRIGIGAQMVGLAQGALDHTLAYVQERQQFGQAIGEFQAVQFQLAQIQTEVEMARLGVYNAARLHGAGRPFLTEGAMAKLFSSQVAERATSLAVQLFGGVGYTKDYPVEKLYRDAKIGQIYEGTSNVQLQTIAKQILPCSA